MYCLRLFNVVLQELHYIYCYYCGVFIESMRVPSFIVIDHCVSELHGHICRYWLFTVVLQELHCLPNCLHVCMIRV